MFDLAVENFILDLKVKSIATILKYDSYFRVTDAGLLHTVTNCKHIVDLNISGCKVHDAFELKFYIKLMLSRFECLFLKVCHYYTTIRT
jgi:hypothetical protein